jgi:hypothetical protein
VLAGEGLEHGCLHDPAQAFQAEHVLGEQVVLDDPPVLGGVLRDDSEVLVVK